MVSRSLFFPGVFGIALAGIPAQGPTKDFWTTPPVHEAVLSSAFYDASIALCLGGTQAWFTSARPGVGGYDIWYATRPNTSTAFGAPIMSGLSTSNSESYIDITEDGLEIFISSAPASSSPHDMYHCLRPGTGVDFLQANVAALAAVNTASDEGDPSVSADALSLYFQSDRAGGVSNAIWVATRPTRAAPFGAPQLAQDSPGTDHSPSISASGNFLIKSIAAGSQSLLHQSWRLDATQAFPTGAGTQVMEFASPQWQANGQYERHDSEYWLVSTNTAWGGVSSSIYYSKRLVPGLVADVNSVPSATGGTIILTSAEDSALTPAIHIYYLGFSLLPTALAIPGIMGELALNPSPIFQMGGSSPVDGIASLTIPVPPGLPVGGRLHFQALRLLFSPQTVALSTHESVVIN
jgi:hypothetical protein